MNLDIQLIQLSTPSKVLVRDLHLKVPSGVIHTVMGASGAGKSSLLPDGLAFEGRISLDGRRIDQLPTERRHVGILFQDDLLFAHMTVAENLLFAVPPGAGAAGSGDDAVCQRRPGPPDPALIHRSPRKPCPCSTAPPPPCSNRL